MLETLQVERAMVFPYKLIDLTHTLDSNIPTWNGHCGFNHGLHLDYADCKGDDKFRVMKLNMHAGIGTHMDAPSHCIPGSLCIDDLDVNDLVFPCVVIDISDKCHERYSLSIQDVMDFESTYGSITKGSYVMVHTGWSRFWDEPSKYHNNHIFPSISEEAAKLLLDQGVNALGIDTLSSDRPEDGFKVHQAFLGAGKILIENVANLGQIPPTGCYVMALPIKIQDGTEAPIRLVGLVEKENYQKFLMQSIEELERIIYDREHKIPNFITLIDSYLDLSIKLRQKNPKSNFPELTKTLLPLKTFLYNTDYTKVTVSSKHSTLDSEGIDAIISNKKSEDISIQISYATDGQQESFRKHVLKESHQISISATSKIYSEKKYMEEDLFRKHPELKNTSLEENLKYAGNAPEKKR